MTMHNKMQPNSFKNATQRVHPQPEQPAATIEGPSPLEALHARSHTGSSSLVLSNRIFVLSEKSCNDSSTPKFSAMHCIPRFH